MKEKLLIALLCGLLMFLLFSLCFTNKNMEENNPIEENNLIENNNTLDDDYAIYVRNANTSVQWLAKMENDMAKEKTIAEEIKLHYMNKYPDLYVDSIKPVICVEEKKIAYLTFDDGPSSTTCDILNVLEKYHVKATFFVLGCTITEEGKECLKAMVEQGHAIGIHTYSHSHKKIYASVEAYLDDFYQDYELIYEITGVKVNIFRFPWGSTTSYNKGIRKELFAEMERRGFTYYDWNVSAEDSVGKPTTYRIKKNIMKDLERFKFPIILMHDSSINELTAITLPDIIDSIIEKGYTFDTLNHKGPYHFK